MLQVDDQIVGVVIENSSLEQQTGDDVAIPGAWAWRAKAHGKETDSLNAALK
ncbi:hypothetical protein D3C77_745750 [compost metagenome]